MYFRAVLLLSNLEADLTLHSSNNRTKEADMDVCIQRERLKSSSPYKLSLGTDQSASQRE